MKLAERMERLGTETAFEILARARQLEAEGRSVVHLEIGEPDFDTPANIVKAGADALQAGWTHYGPSPGLPELRETIAAEIRKTRGIPCEADNIVVVPGGKPIMFFLMLALLEEGTEAVYPNPGFPIYESMINYCGAKAVAAPLREENAFNLDIAELETLLNDRTRLLILNSPGNPCGNVLSKDEIAKIAEILRGYPDCWIMSDEIYSRILYGEEHHSIGVHEDLRERLVILDGFSKTFAMTGWRLGYGVMSPEMATHIARLQTNSTSCTAAFTQMAGVEALTGPQDAVEAMVQEFKRRRDVIVEGLNAIPGISCTTPKGAFYVFPNFKELGPKSKQLEQIFLEECGVACLTGTSFGEHGEGYIRFSYANSVENIEEALKRIAERVRTGF